MSLGKASTISVLMAGVICSRKLKHTGSYNSYFYAFAFFTTVIAQDGDREDGPGAQHVEEPASPASGGKQVAVKRGLVPAC